MKKHDYVIGLVLIGEDVNSYLKTVTIERSTRSEALAQACLLLKPNNLQFLTVVSVL